MDNKICPPPKLLSALIHGQIVEPKLSELSSHLEACETCQERARTLPPSDTLIDSLRGEAPAEDRIAQSAPRPLIEKLKQIPKGHSKIKSQTEALVPPASGAASGAASEPSFDFLTPPGEGGEIGRLGHYRIREVLGAGGMGAVFLADDPKLDRKVALKVMLPKVAADPTAKDRFLREARAAAKIKSEHIVTIYQVDEANGVPYLAMELLEGESLDDVLRGKAKLSMSRIVQIAREITKGLAAAHEKGLVHRDIKPGNVWVEHEPGAPSGEGRIKILDFGLAHAEKDDTRITQSGVIIGTPAFMSPEQARGDKGLDARADLFSLGCLLYYMCTGEIPFTAETTMGMLLAVAVNDPIPVSKLNPSLPPKLSKLIMQLLEKVPAKRPQSARDVIARLDEIEPPQNGLAPRHSGPNWRKYGPIALVGGTLFVAAMFVAGMIFFWQTPDGRVVRIECNDPGVKIAFDDSTLKVVGAYTMPIEIKPGAVGLTIVKKGDKDDDFEFHTDKLVVNKGDKVVLKIEVSPGKVRIIQDGDKLLDSLALTPPVPIDPWEKSVASMDAAKQVKAVAAKLKERNPNFDAKTLLPKVENGVVTRVIFEDASKLKDFSPLRAFPGLGDVMLFGKGTGAVDLGSLRGMKLVSLGSNGGLHTDLSALKGMPLQRALFWGLGKDVDLSPLRGMKLREVNVGMSDVKEIAVFKGMPLEFVCLNITQVEDLTPLKGAPIRKLLVANTNVRDLTPVADAPIEYLAVEGSLIRDLSLLRKMPLKTLYLDYAPSKHAELLRSIPTLEWINERPAAELLNLANQVDDPDRWAADWVLSLGGVVKVNGEDRIIASRADLPKGKFTLTVISLFGRRVPDVGVENLKGLTGLTELCLYDTKLTDSALRQVGELTSLTTLDLGETKTTDAGLESIKSLKELTTLSIHYTGVSGPWLENLKHFKKLTSINLNGAATDADLHRLLGCTSLKVLSLQLTQISDAGLAVLKGLPNLTRLDVRRTEVTAKGLADFHAAVPGCRIEHDGGVIEAKK